MQDGKRLQTLLNRMILEEHIKERLCPPGRTKISMNLIKRHALSCPYCRGNIDLSTCRTKEESDQQPTIRQKKIMPWQIWELSPLLEGWSEDGVTNYFNTPTVVVLKVRRKNLAVVALVHKEEYFGDIKGTIYTDGFYIELWNTFEMATSFLETFITDVTPHHVNIDTLLKVNRAPLPDNDLERLFIETETKVASYFASCWKLKAKRAASHG